MHVTVAPTGNERTVTPYRGENTTSSRIALVDEPKQHMTIVATLTIMCVISIITYIVLFRRGIWDNS